LQSNALDGCTCGRPLLFGSGRVSNLMGDVALGLKSFRKTMADDENATPGAVASVLTGPAMPADPAERL
jgi:sec-independent protein translocase protein TatA